MPVRRQAWQARQARQARQQQPISASSARPKLLMRALWVGVVVVRGLWVLTLWVLTRRVFCPGRYSMCLDGRDTGPLGDQDTTEPFVWSAGEAGTGPDRNLPVLATEAEAREAQGTAVELYQKGQTDQGVKFDLQLAAYL
jgi:hypothetical protein